MTNELAKLSRDDRFIDARMTQIIDHPPEAIWNALTDPAVLPTWLCPGHIELRQGGSARFDFADNGAFIDSEVSGVSTGRLLEYSWSSPGEPRRPVRWEIEPDGQESRLTLYLKIPDGEDAARACAEWAMHLEMLAATLDGAPITFPFLEFKSACGAYQVKLAAAGITLNADQTESLGECPVSPIRQDQASIAPIP